MYISILIVSEPDAANSVDGLGRNGVMYAVHGNTEKHTECLELIIRQTECLLDHQANGNAISCSLIGSLSDFITLKRVSINSYVNNILVYHKMLKICTVNQFITFTYHDAFLFNLFLKMNLLLSM